jgi:hypothetical protein
MFIINLHAKFCHMRRFSVKVQVKFALEHAMNAHRGVGIELYFSFNIGARWGWTLLGNMEGAPLPGTVRER